ncbi:MAG: DUF4037 domain-containing protein [Chloroflexi bacterium]|nr:MAG: DUF4037 domain-containing protein [Chloroflexota bacterium]
MGETILESSREFFNLVIKPILEKEFPVENRQACFGFFGYGSEVLKQDDAFSKDHHWGVRVNGLLPEKVFKNRNEEIQEVVRAQLPDTWRGQSLTGKLSDGWCLSLSSFEDYLVQTLGIDHAPKTHEEWLGIPEEDIMHIVAGEVWHDHSGRFTAIRQTLEGYYPEPVRLRRIAHWCRYFSGMGTYALKRAILRSNELYATTAFAKAIRLGIQLAFLLDKKFFPYDKWLLVYFDRLPRLATPLRPLVNEAVSLSTGWDRKLELLDTMADILDVTMVTDGIIRPHPKFSGSATSGYRITEHAYAEIMQGLPKQIRTMVPVWDQIYLERWHSGYVSTLDLAAWDEILNLTPVNEEPK